MDLDRSPLAVPPAGIPPAVSPEGRALLEHRPADTVVVVGRDVGREEESLTVTTLAELDAESIDMKCLLIIGATSTRRTSSGQVWTPRYVR